MTAGAHASINRTARLAGGLYLSLIPFSIFSFVYVPSVLLARGDAAATSRNIMASEWLFRSATISHLLSQIIVVFLALALYRLLKPVNKDHAVLMVVLALLGLPIAFLNEVHNLAVLRLLNNPDDGAFTSAQIQAQAMLFLDMSRNGILVAQVFWGLWLLPLGSLVFRSGFLPRMLGVPVVIAGGAYLFDSCTQMLFPGLATISQFTFIGELLLPLWLLIKSVTVERWQQVVVAQEAAEAR
ncbi:MAG: DUF4386 domain-containing protein [Acidobacteriota bacterium]